MVMTMMTEKSDTEKLIECINFKRQQEGDDWTRWESSPAEWRRVEEIAKAAEAILGTGHFYLATCTGFQFAVKVYNEITKSPLNEY